MPMFGFLEQPKVFEKNDDSGGGGGHEPSRPFKHIIIGIDGTWQAAFRDPFQSNVHRLNIALNYDDDTEVGNPQIFIYLPGVGTWNRSSETIAGALGEGLDELVLGAYINVAANFVPGDKIYIFGFSRGAVAARALASFISHSGLLKANSLHLTKNAWGYFTGFETENYAAHANELNNVKIEFLGLWDSVPGPYRLQDLRRRFQFEDLRLNRDVRHGVHILSIDETRRAFAPLLWDGARKDQVLEQIWMPGVHGDIGGGYSSAFLSTLSLLVMIDRLSHYCPDLSFDEDYIQNVLLRIIEREDVVVNDEWQKYVGRYVKPFRHGLRQVSAAADHRHCIHTIVDALTANTREIMVRSKRKKYAPSLVVSGGKKLGSTDFLSGKLRHTDRLKQALVDKFN